MASDLELRAEVRTIEWCNDVRVSVLFDANVILNAKAHRDSFFEDFMRVGFPLRLYASTTLYEIGFARKTGDAPKTLRENEDWLRLRFADRLRFTEKVGNRFEGFLNRDARLARGRADLGDVMLACFSLARGRGGKRLAIATNDQDFAALPVILVREFLPPAILERLEVR